MEHPTEHQAWCDRRHVELGTPDCSAEVGRVDRVDLPGTTLLVAIYGTDITVGVETDTEPMVLSFEKAHQLGRLLHEAAAIVAGTWPPLAGEHGWISGSCGTEAAQ